jgi:excisionase family DNA binding protein
MKLLSIEAAAEVLDVSPRTIMRMIADHQLPAICLRSGKRKKIMRIRSEQLEKWVTQKERESTRGKVVSIANAGGTNAD